MEHSSKFRKILKRFWSSKRSIRTFSKDTRGNVAMIFGVSLLPIMISVGVAVDLSRAMVVRERLAQAIDAAALAAGASTSLSLANQTNHVKNYIAANYNNSQIGALDTLTVAEVNDVITVTASAKINTVFLGIIGYNDLSINVSTEVMRNISGLELVMVLDNTGSMSGSKISDLRTSANKLVDVLYGGNPTNNLLKIGLVPFAASVNIGDTARAEGWMDENGDAAIAQSKFNYTAGQTVWDLYDAIPNRSWNGCVEARQQPLNTTDDPPVSNDTLFQPYFAPDERDASEYDNNYLPDGISGRTNKRQKYVGKYNGTNVSSSSKGPLFGCTVDPVTRLTTNRTTIESGINAMGASGYTHIPMGLVWGWRLISPGAPFSEGADYTNTDWKKAMVILTDGENTIDRESNYNKSNYSAYGHLKKARLGTTDASTFENQLDDDTAVLCQKVKNEGIRVYSITFQVSTNTVRNLMRACASEPGLYFDSPNGSQLEAAFEAIARDLNNLRISK
jgi:Flp pilus assembly protein TadG